MIKQFSRLSILGVSLVSGMLLPAYAGEDMVSLSPTISTKSTFTASDVNVLSNGDEAVLNVEPRVYVLEQSLPAFLRQAARRSGMQVTLSKKVRGILKKVELPTDIRKIMPEIAEQFDLQWHIQQKQLFVSVGSENTNRVIYLGAMGFDDLNNALDQAGIETNSYDISYVEESNSAIVNGSVAYIANVELIVESYKKNLAEKSSGVKIIRYGVVGN